MPVIGGSIMAVSDSVSCAPCKGALESIIKCNTILLFREEPLHG